MAELAAVMAGTSLASSIITFLQVAYNVGNRTAEFVRTAGELPSDLKATKDLIDIITRRAERLKSKLPGAGISGPPTQKEMDLNVTFQRLTSLVNDFLSILDMNDGKNPLWKAWKSVRKECEVSNIQRELDRVILSITQILTEGLHSSTDDLHYIALDLKEEQMDFHRNIEAKMSVGFETLSDELHGSQQKIVQKMEELLSDHEEISSSTLNDLVSGQRDISQSLNGISHLIVTAREQDGDQLAERLQILFSEQQQVAINMLRAALKDFEASTGPMAAQLQALVEQLNKEGLKMAGRVSLVGDSTGIRLRAEFEFGFHSDIIALHVNRCVAWVSSNLFPAIQLSPFQVQVPIPTVRLRRRTYCRTSCNLLFPPNKVTLDLVIKYAEGQYHRVRVDLNQYDGGIFEAMQTEYRRYRGNFWLTWSLTVLDKVEYVKYDSYSDELRCFQRIQPIAPALNSRRILPGSHYMVHMMSRPKDYQPTTKAITESIQELFGGLEQGHAIYLEERVNTVRVLVMSMCTLVGSTFAFLQWQLKVVDLRFTVYLQVLFTAILIAPIIFASGLALGSRIRGIDLVVGWKAVLIPLPWKSVNQNSEESTRE